MPMQARQTALSVAAQRDEEELVDTPEMVLVQAQTEALVITLGERRAERFMRAMADRVVAGAATRRSGRMAVRSLRAQWPTLMTLLRAR